MLNVTGTLPSFFRYIVAVDVTPGSKVPQLTLESAVVQPLFEYTPNCTDGEGEGDGLGEGDGGVTTLILPVLETVRVATSAPKALTTKAITANAKTVPMVALRMAIIFH